MFPAKSLVKDKSNSSCISIVQHDIYYDNPYLSQACLEGTEVA